MKHIRCEYEIAITGSCPLRVASFEYRFYCMADICFGCNIAVCNGRFVIFIRNQSRTTDNCVKMSVLLMYTFMIDMY